MSRARLFSSGLPLVVQRNVFLNESIAIFLPDRACRFVVAKLPYDEKNVQFGFMHANVDGHLV